MSQEVNVAVAVYGIIVTAKLGGRGLVSVSLICSLEAQGALKHFMSVVRCAFPGNGFEVQVVVFLMISIDSVNELVTLGDELAHNVTAISWVDSQ